MGKWKVVIRDRNFGWRASVHHSRHEHGSGVAWSGWNGHGSREDRTYVAPGLVRREAVEVTGRSETTPRDQVLRRSKEASRVTHGSELTRHLNLKGEDSKGSWGRAN